MPELHPDRAALSYMGLQAGVGGVLLWEVLAPHAD